MNKFYLLACALVVFLFSTLTAAQDEPRIGIDDFPSRPTPIPSNGALVFGEPIDLSPLNDERSVHLESGGQDNYLVAQRRGRRRRGRHTRGMRVVEGIKGNLGVALGDGDNSLAFGVDYVMMLKRLVRSVPYSVALTGGFIYWSSSNYSVMVFDGGVDYYLKINRRFRIFAGGRLGYARVEEDTAYFSKSETDIFLQPDFGVEYRVKKEMSVGGEFRVPLGDYNANLLLGYFKVKI